MKKGLLLTICSVLFIGLLGCGGADDRLQMKEFRQKKEHRRETSLKQLRRWRPWMLQMQQTF